MVDVVRHRLAKVRIGLQPRLWLAYFFDVVKLVMPDRNVGSLVVSSKDGCEFHFDGVTGTIADRTFRTRGEDQVVLKLGRALLDCADHVLSNVAGQPLINRRDLWSEALKLVDRHRADLEQGPGQKVLDTLLCGRQLHALRPRTSRVLQ